MFVPFGSGHRQNPQFSWGKGIGCKTGRLPGCGPNGTPDTVCNAEDATRVTVAMAGIPTCLIHLMHNIVCRTPHCCFDTITATIGTLKSFFLWVRHGAGSDTSALVQRLQCDLREKLATYTPVRFAKPGDKPKGPRAPWEYPTDPGMLCESLLTQFESPLFGDRPMALELSVDDTENLFATCAVCYSKHNTSVKARAPKRQRLEDLEIKDSVLTNICTHARTKTHQCNLLSYYKGARDVLRVVSECRGQAEKVGEDDNEPGLDGLYEVLVATCQLREQYVIRYVEEKAGETWDCDDVLLCNNATPCTKLKLASHRLPGEARVMPNGVPAATQMPNSQDGSNA
jgi:hypothetical protein